MWTESGRGESQEEQSIQSKAMAGGTQRRKLTLCVLSVCLTVSARQAVGCQQTHSTESFSLLLLFDTFNGSSSTEHQAHYRVVRPPISRNYPTCGLSGMDGKCVRYTFCLFDKWKDKGDFSLLMLGHNRFGR